MLEFILKNNLSLKKDLILSIIERYKKLFKGQYKNDSELLNLIIKRKGNLKEFILLNIYFDDMYIRNEFIILLVKNSITNELELSLNMIFYDNRIIKHCRQYEGDFNELKRYKCNNKGIKDIIEHINSLIKEEINK